MSAVVVSVAHADPQSDAEKAARAQANAAIDAMCLPPTIATIMKKGSDAPASEQKVMQDWMQAHAMELGQLCKQKKAAAPPPAKVDPPAPTKGTPIPGSFNPSDINFRNFLPTEDPKADFAKRKVPKKEDVAKQAKAFADALEKKLDAKDKGILQKLLISAKNDYHYLAKSAVFMYGVDADVSSVMLARAVGQVPDDASAVLSLSALLHGRQDWAAAYDLATYVDSFQPNNPEVMNTRAFPAMYGGDFTLARTLFSSSLRANPDQARAYMGTALLAAAKGDMLVAQHDFRNSLAHQWNPIAASGAHANGDKADALPPIDDDRVARPGEPKGSDPGQEGGPESNGTGDAGNWGEAMDYPDLPATPREFVKETGGIGQWMVQGQQDLKTINDVRKQALADFNASPPKYGPSAMDDGTIIWPRIFTRQLFMLDEAEKRYYAHVGQHPQQIVDQMANWAATTGAQNSDIEKQFAKDVSGCGTDEGCKKRGEIKHCKAKEALQKRAHEFASSIWAQHAVPIRDASLAYYNETSKVIREITDPRLWRLANINRRWNIRHFLRINPRMALGVWVSVMPGLDPNCDSAKLEQELAAIIAAENAKDGKADPQKPPACDPSTDLALSISIASLTLGCDKVEFEFGEGLGIDMEHHFAVNGLKQPNDEIWIGAIAKTGGAVGVAKFEAAAKAGVYFQQTAGAISDYGFKASAEVDAQAAGVIRNETKVELKISAMNSENSGPSASSTTKFGPMS
ncbi:MAG TPA: hypothetical protein VGM90_15560 [Kofleriaceae bacterium]|jgi:hypothetical protein